MQTKKPKNKSKAHSVQDITNMMEQLEDDSPPAPVLRRYKTNDTTIEKLGEMLRQNPAGMMILRDELVGLLATWEKSGHEDDRTFYLESWNGNGSFDSDRIGRGSISIPNLCCSLFGGIQPDKLRSLLELMSDALANDGTLQRFQLLVYPDNYKWEYRDQIPDKEARDKIYKLFAAVADFIPEASGASPKDEYNKFPYFRFSPEAQKVFIAWQTHLHTVQLPAATQESAFIAQHLSKYDKLFPALALIFHIVDCASSDIAGDISKECALRAGHWCKYLESHARRCYGLLTDGGLCSAQHLADKIREGKLKDGFTPRDVQRSQWSRLTTSEAVDTALQWLEDEHWLRSHKITPSEKGGRPSICYRINPKILSEVQSKN